MITLIIFSFLKSYNKLAEIISHLISSSFPFTENMWPRYEICLFSKKPSFCVEIKMHQVYFPFIVNAHALDYQIGPHMV